MRDWSRSLAADCLALRGSFFRSGFRLSISEIAGCNGFSKDHAGSAKLSAISASKRHKGKSFGRYIVGTVRTILQLWQLTNGFQTWSKGEGAVIGKIGQNLRAKIAWLARMNDTPAPG